MQAKLHALDMLFSDKGCSKSIPFKPFLLFNSVLWGENKRQCLCLGAAILNLGVVEHVTQTFQLLVFTWLIVFKKEGRGLATTALSLLSLPGPLQSYFAAICAAKRALASLWRNTSLLVKTKQTSNWTRNTIFAVTREGRVKGKHWEWENRREGRVVFERKDFSQEQPALKLSPVGQG